MEMNDRTYRSGRPTSTIEPPTVASSRSLRLDAVGPARPRHEAPASDHRRDETTLEPFMSDRSLVESLERLTERVVTLSLRDEPLRAALRQFAQHLLDLTAEETVAAPEAATEPSTPPPVEVSPAVNGKAPEAAPSPPEPAMREIVPEEPAQDAIELASQLWQGRAKHIGIQQAPSVAVTPAPTESSSAAPSWGAPSNDGLQLIERRCRLKAEGARWALRRQKRLREGADFRTEIEPIDREIIAQAKELPDCFLWMNHPSGPAPSPLEQWDLVANAFDAVADALALVRAVLEDPEDHRDIFEQALDLLAEAQSALRAAIHQIDGPTDADQHAIFNWLRSTAAEQQIFIQRYMRADDPADPAGCHELRQRLEALDARFEESRQERKFRRKRLNKLRYVAGRLAENPADVSQWRTLINTVEELIAGGVPPSNRDLRDLLLPIVDDMPELERLPGMEELPPGMTLALREIDRYLANRPGEENEACHQPSPEVRQAARLLKGKAMVLIGGERRHHAEQALKEAFGLSELIWIATREHESVATFEPYVARNDLAVVVLAIRWSSHSYGDVKQFCDQYGKPLVRLPAGYNPNQVAVHILSQCSDRLAQQH